MPRVVVDAGHGGASSAGSSTAYGCRGPTGTAEKDVTLDIARHVVARLGRDAVLTRADDHNLSLAARARQATHHDAAVFVSIHANSGDPHLCGPETLVHPRAAPHSLALAGNIQRALERLDGRRAGRPPLVGELAVLTPTLLGRSVSACLVEVDYLSNPRQEQRLRSPAARAAIGSAIARAIREHLERERDG